MKYVRGAHWRLATPRTSTAQHSGVLGKVPVQTNSDPLRLETTGPAMTAEAPRSAAMVEEKSIVIVGMRIVSFGKLESGF